MGLFLDTGGLEPADLGDRTLNCVSTYVLPPGAALPPCDPAGTEPPGHPRPQHAPGPRRHRPSAAGNRCHRRQGLCWYVTLSALAL